MKLYDMLNLGSLELHMRLMGLFLKLHHMVHADLVRMLSQRI